MQTNAQKNRWPSWRLVNISGRSSVRGSNEGSPVNRKYKLTLLDAVSFNIQITCRGRASVSFELLMNAGNYSWTGRTRRGAARAIRRAVANYRARKRRPITYSNNSMRVSLTEPSPSTVPFDTRFMHSLRSLCEDDVRRKGSGRKKSIVAANRG